MTRWLFKAIRNPAAVSQRLGRIIDMVDQNYTEIVPKLTGIQIDAKDDNAKKCKCSASLVLTNGNTLDMGYTAWLTEDGNLYVELHSLE